MVSGKGLETGRGGRYVWLWLLGIALGWFEASVVVYLRALYYPGGFAFPVVLVPTRIAVVEITREAASLLLMAAAARLAGSTFVQRFAAFALLFGVWDLVYYAALWAILSWPASLGTWDILFLIPVPWLGPVWAPCIVSVALVVAGSWVYLTPARPRELGRRAWSIMIAGGLVVIGSFVWNWRCVAEQRTPDHFPAALFWLGFGVALAQFLRSERPRPRPRSE